jgi:hypothetical protein
MIDDLVQPWINNPFHGCRAPVSFASGQPGRQIFDVPGVVNFYPLIDYLARDPQLIGNVHNRLSLVKPQKGLCSSESRGVMCVV